MSGDLKKRGMKYMGSVTVYSHLQACGIINDHLESCFRYAELVEISDAVPAPWDLMTGGPDSALERGS